MIGRKFYFVADPPVYIYALCDPLTDEIRYIGQTASPQTRINAHIMETSRSNQSSRKEQWIHSLISNGLFPYLLILKITTDENADIAERELIKEYEDKCDLVNGTSNWRYSESNNKKRLKNARCLLKKKPQPNLFIKDS